MKYTMQARFIGQDGSLGYRTGHEYALVVQEYGILDRFFFGVSLKIHRLYDNGGHCPYKSMKTFLQNWEVIHSAKN